MKFFITLLLIVPFSMSAQLKLSWKVFDDDAKVWYPIGEKGSVQEAYIQQGILPDPFVGTNEDLFQWMENKQWRFEANLEVSEEDYASSKIAITFENVDTYASIYINGTFVQQTDNYFRPYRIVSKSFLKVGSNTISLVFTPPIVYHEKAYKALSVKYPTPNDVSEIGVSSMTRKPQYQFGWDWALRINTIGLNKPAYVDFYDHPKIDYVKVETRLIEANAAYLNLTLQLHEQIDSRISIKSKLFGIFEHVQLNKGKINIPVVMYNPQLWWPRDYGVPYLYEDEWEILNSDRQVIAKKALKFGIRTSELINQPDDLGTNFYFKINGKSIFCKGGNYIPQEIFPAKITDESLIKMVDEMFAANFNMLRIWGGGIYAEEALMNRCDELGIMVWHDFMFACALYPGSEEFLKSVGEELDAQIPRLAAHPSLIYLNGNNEVEIASKYWGFQFKYGINTKEQAQLDKEYAALFKQLIPSKIAQNSFLPYYHTSPQSHWGKDEWYKHGSQHYWGVWHGKDPIEDFGKKSGRFNAEYGFQSFPEFTTLSTFSDTADWQLDSKVMRQHQKSEVGNQMIEKHANLLYGRTNDFKRFVYHSQLTQAKAVSIAIASHRLTVPYCMGTIYWQVNDCWPAVSWSSIDYYGNWKALHYQVRRDFESIALLKKVSKIGEETVYFISDLPDPIERNLHVEILNKSGEVVANKLLNFRLEQHVPHEISLDSIQDVVFDARQQVVRYSWLNKEGKKQQMYDMDQLETASQKVTVELKILSVDSLAKTVVIEVATNSFLKDFWLVSKKQNVRFDDNFRCLPPGKNLFTIHFEDFLTETDFEYYYR